MREKTDTVGLDILVTGGAGFLGKAILRELVSQTPLLRARRIRVLDTCETRGISSPVIEYLRGDVRDRELVKQACAGMDVVIHSAAIVDWGTRSREEILSVNHRGTLNVIDACRENRVRALVYTSSLDVLYDGKPLAGVNEETPYPEKHINSYCLSKFLAEKAVAAAGEQGLPACSLRPADIYGEGDPYHIGNLVAMARKGFYVRLGNGKSLCQHVYVGNAAHAHLMAAAALLNGTPISGRAYFITDQPGSNFFTFFDSFVRGAGYRIWPGNLWIPRPVAFFLGLVSEGIAVLVRPVKNYRPKLSRFAVAYTCTDYTFTSARAESDFGFFPRYSPEEAFERTVAFFRNRFRAQDSVTGLTHRSENRDRSSKAVPWSGPTVDSPRPCRTPLDPSSSD